MNLRDYPGPEEIASSAIATGFVELPLHWQVAAAVADLSIYHRDPFDRAIVAQAMSEPVHKLTAYSPLVRAV